MKTHIMRWAPMDWRTSRVRARSAMSRDPMLRLVYLEALSALYEAGGSLPADPAALADELLLPVKEIARCLPVLDEIARTGAGRGGLLIEDGRITNGRVTEDLKNEQAFREQQATHGKRGGRRVRKGQPKATLSQPLGFAKGTPTPPAPSPSPSPVPTHNGTDSSASPPPPSLFPLSPPDQSKRSVDTRVRTTAPIVPDVVSWSQDACEIWGRVLGEPPGGQIGSELKPLERKHGWATVRPLWEAACVAAASDSEPGKFTPAQFARSFLARLNGARGMLPPARAAPNRIVATNRTIADDYLAKGEGGNNG